MRRAITPADIATAIDIISRDSREGRANRLIMAGYGTIEIARTAPIELAGITPGVAALLRRSVGCRVEARSDVEFGQIIDSSSSNAAAQRRWWAPASMPSS
jgi:hypothetical protein